MNPTTSIKAAILGAIMALGPALSASAQVTYVTLRVDGLSCPFCAYSLEKKLKNVDGVDELNINVKEGVATLTPKDGERIDVPSLPKAVQSAGFTPRDIQVRARGRVETAANGPALIASDGRTLFVLQPNDVLGALTAGDETTYEVLGNVVMAPDGQATDTVVLALVTATPDTAED